MSTDSTIVLLTAGNSGLGVCIAKTLIRSSPTPYTVILTSRSAEKGEQAVKEVKDDEESAKALSAGSQVKSVKMDLDDEKECEDVVSALEKEYGRVDVVIHNAAQHLDYPLRDGKLTRSQAFDRSLHTNVTATSYLTSLAVPLLLKSQNPRIVFIGSGVSCMTNHHLPPGQEGGIQPNAVPEEKGWPKKPVMADIMTYRTSKAAVNMMALEWLRVLKPDGVKVFIIDPGWMATGLGGQDAEQAKQYGALDPMDSGRFITGVVEGKRDDDQGKLIGDKGEIVPW